MVDKCLNQVSHRRAPVDRLARQLALAGITDMPQANRYLRKHHLSAFKRGFTQAPCEHGSAFVPLGSVDSKEILCEHFERAVRPDNCMFFEGLLLQIPAQRLRYHFVKTRVRGHRHLDDTQAVFCGPRFLARYNRLDKSICYEQNLALCACVIWERWR